MITIEDERKWTAYRFQNVNEGDVFEYRGDFYIAGYFEAHDRIYALNLSNGDIETINEIELVTVVDAKITIYDHIR